MSTPRVSRRAFIERSLLAGGAAAFGFPAVTSAKSPNSKLNVACIAVGGRGGSHVSEVKKMADLTHMVAMCDVNSKNLERAASQFPGVRTYSDFRELHAKMEDIDALFIATTEHTHAFAMIPALRAGKHVYCEKPLTRDVFECRMVMEEARKANVITQMGTQMHSAPTYHRTVELIQSGVIGQIKEVHTWVSRSWGMQSKAEAEANGDLFAKGGVLDYIDKMPVDAMPVPAELDWDLWIGPAAMRPYHEIYFPGPRWYRYWNFANGTMSDLGSHSNDLPFWALKLDHPVTVEGHGPTPHPEIAPANMSATWTYGQRGNLAPVTHHWYQGTQKPKIWTEGKIPQWKDGSLFIGEHGMVLANYGGHLLMLDDKVQEFKRPAKTIEDGPSHQQQFVECARAGKKAPCDFSYSGLLTIANHLGGVAYRTGTPIKWDHLSGKTDNDAANKLLQREYRAGWKLL